MAAVRAPRRLALALLVAVATALRCYQLGAVGFSEDEVKKLEALDSYRHLDFTANAEHPMLMKLLALVSAGGAQVLNAGLLDRLALSISPEAALRFPNALAGGLTALWILLLAELFFGTAAGWIAGALWAVDVNAISINRIGKEDSLLVLFLLMAAWF